MPQEEPIGYRILRAIRRIIRRTSEYSRSIGRLGGITVPQMLCLRAVSKFPENSEATVAQVAQAVQLSTPTVSRILDQLEKGGYIARQRTSVDRRKVCVTLTPAGQQRLQNLPTPLHEQFLKRLDTLAPAERQQLLTALERIVELIDAEGLDAAPFLTPELDVRPGDAESSSAHS